MRKDLHERVLARALAIEIKNVQGSDASANGLDPVVVTFVVRKDITDKNNGDVPAS